MKPLITSIFLILISFSTALLAVNPSVKPFLGPVPGDTNTVIKPYQDGFQITTGGDVYVFLPKGKKGFFEARNSEDPLEGGALIWATIADRRLDVNFFFFDENGQYIIDTYCYTCYEDQKQFPTSFKMRQDYKGNEKSLFQLKNFYGTFVGRANQTFDIDGIKETGVFDTRDIDVVVKPYARGRGFEISWITVIYQNDRLEPDVKRNQGRAKFFPTKIPNTFKFVRENNPFKVAREKGLGDGAPLIWAQKVGNQLNIHALIIDKSGRYILQNYLRTLTENGLDLEFDSIKDGKVIKKVTGKLTKVKP